MGMDKGKREKEIFDLLKKNQIQLHLKHIFSWSGQ